MMLNFSTLTIMLIQYLNTPYKWGGVNPLEGLDCSGLVYLVLKDLKVYSGRRTTSQGFYNWAQKQNYHMSEPCHGCLLFFGPARDSIKHVAIALNDTYMIEAGGGDSTTTTLAAAKSKLARVRISAISRRKDLVASVKFY